MLIFAETTGSLGIASFEVLGTWTKAGLEFLKIKSWSRASSHSIY